jgi:hypothetical protein
MRHVVIILIFAGVSGSAFDASAQARDNWFWPAVQVESKVFKDLTLSLNLEGRINGNESDLSGFFGELEGKWDFNKNLAASLNYRLGGRQVDGFETDYVKGQRITLYGYGKIKFGRFSITDRAGLLRQYLDSRATPRDYIRNKITLKFEATKKLTPLTYVEMFYRIDTEPGKINEWRYAGGLEWEITKRHELKGVYMLANQVNVKNPDKRNIWALTYTYKIKPKKKVEEKE